MARIEMTPEYTQKMMGVIITFLEEWKAEKENGAVYQIPTVDLLLEELKEQYGTNGSQPETESRDRE